MNEEKLTMLRDIRALCKGDPDFFSHVIHAGINGMQEKVAEANQRACDFEVAASAMLGLMAPKRVTARTRDYWNDLISSKIGKWLDKSALNWKGLENLK